MELILQEKSFTLEAEGMRIESAYPIINLLIGDEETPLKLECYKSSSERRHKNTFCGGFGAEWGIEVSGKRVTVSVSAINGNGSDVRLRSIELLSCPGLACVGAQDEWTISGYAFNDAYKGAGTLDEIKERRAFEDFAALYTGAGETGAVFCASGEPEAFLQFEVTPGPAGGICLSAYSEMNDVVLPAGTARHAQEMSVIFAGYDEAADLFADLNAGFLKPRKASKVFGWCSWYDLFLNVSAQKVEEVSGSFKQIGVRARPDVIQIDDGYQICCGDWNENERFPRGLEETVKRIEDDGFRAGVWVAPLGIRADCAVYAEHPEWLQRDKDGNLLGAAGNWGVNAYWLDPSRPECARFITEVVQKLKAKGFKYFKIDFNILHEKCRFYDGSKTRLQIYRDLYALYRAILGGDIYLLACSQATRGVVGFADACRIGPDAGPSFDDPMCAPVRKCIYALGGNAFLNGKWFVSDPDVFYMRYRADLPTRQFSDDEWRTWNSFVGVSGGNALTSEPIQTPEYLSMLEDMEAMYPPVREYGRPFYGGADKTYARFGYRQIRDYGTALVLLLWNASDESRDIQIGISELAGDYQAYSFWDNEYVGIVRKDTAFTLRPRQCKLLRLVHAGTGGGLSLLGTNLHISMGGEDVSRFEFSSSALKIGLSQAGKLNGSIFVCSENKLTVKDTVNCEAQCAFIEDRVWRIDVAQRNKKTEQTLSLNRFRGVF
ncbi:MAG: alpha-galactosidase [Firmicutes bacterium]|nr:alpha-galactosidase [Bacillota bacterium]